MKRRLADNDERSRKCLSGMHETSPRSALQTFRRRNMAYKIESIGRNGTTQIQEDLRGQKRYETLCVDRLLISGLRQKWAIDQMRHRYLHRCQFPGPDDAFHFFKDGNSYEFIIPTVCSKLTARRYSSNSLMIRRRSCWPYGKHLTLLDA